MKVERIEIYDFKVILSEAEFNHIKEVVDNADIPIERVLLDIIKCGFDVLRNGST